MAQKVIIHSDGGADPNPGIGGWAAILCFGDREKVLKGNEPKTTNNRMELQAAIGALKALKRPCEVEFHTDSEYLRRGITKGVAKWAAAGWRTKQGRQIPNADLWQELVELTRPHSIEWHWVRGHSGDPLNEQVDQLARDARLAITPTIDLAIDTPRLYLRAACRGNPGPGGWGVLSEGPVGREEHSGSAQSTTNNRMELAAAIEGLKHLEPGSSVQVFTTSDYLHQGMTRWIAGWQANGWQKKDGQPVANADLWRKLVDAAGAYDITWVNAKGLQLEGLDLAGKLAAQAASSQQ
jgi:ribonuclease HI